MRTITHVVAKTLVFNDQGLLLGLKRSDDDEHRPGGWDFPGGQVEPGEPVLDGAAREAYEEAGLKLNPDAMQLSFASSRTTFRKQLGQNVNIVWLGYVAKLPEGSEVALSHEHSEYRWFTIDQFLIESNHYGHHDLLTYLKQNRIAAELWDVRP